ncbi:DNA ligase [Enterovibrio coralii]|uniref:ATP-dependent DNA ligase n=1 Tax=Enterovibrio coralii TaxID=294935 RepID=A0A135I509_9GAMM|nr:DNA ligase [Enterovibrio coralii]KXF80523.1 ATP-dependent DNA ligase [Enterovibrio coralii]
MNLSALPLAITLALSATVSASEKETRVIYPQLAKEYQPAKHHNWERFLYSEKLDGIRAIWNGESLLTRSGNPIAAPAWFLAALPNVPIEGELWSGRGQFEHVMSVVMDDEPDEKAWQSIRFMIFDLPLSPEPFADRYKKAIQLVENLSVEHVDYIPHFAVVSESQLDEKLKEINNKGGEGIMLRLKERLYVSGRSDGTLKMTVAQDAEAEVIGYVDGKGKHEGRMGALIVKMENGQTFKIGTGFTDQERENPPKEGTKVTYRYNGYTERGIPKFARFVRVDETKQ